MTRVLRSFLLGSGGARKNKSVLGTRCESDHANVTFSNLHC